MQFRNHGTSIPNAGICNAGWKHYFCNKRNKFIKTNLDYETYRKTAFTDAKQSE